MRISNIIGGGLLCAAVLAGATGCNDYLTVKNPGTVNASDIDPQSDATTLSLSGMQDFNDANSSMAEYGSFLVGETWPATTRQPLFDWGRRAIDPTNQNLGPRFQEIAAALVSNDRVIEALAGTAGEASNINVARSSLFAGYSLILMGENFCQGVIKGGPALTSDQVLDSAITRLTRAVAVGKAITGADAAEAANIVNAAYVGLARAELQLGLTTQAIADAQQVPANFTYNMQNLATVSALTNLFYNETVVSRLLVVPPGFREADPVAAPGVPDPRVPFLTPAPGDVAADGVTPFFAQNKYTGPGDPVRLASGLEAQYIAAEAGGTATQLTLIQTRRAANGIPAYAGPVDGASVLAEFENQRGFEFYLEGKRVGDLRRNGDAVQYVPVTGAPNFNPTKGVNGDQTCVPLPATETLNNPNF